MIIRRTLAKLAVAVSLLGTTAGCFHQTGRAPLSSENSGLARRFEVPQGVSLRLLDDSEEERRALLATLLQDVSEILSADASFDAGRGILTVEQVVGGYELYVDYVAVYSTVPYGVSLQSQSVWGIPYL